MHRAATAIWFLALFLTACGSSTEQQPADSGAPSDGEVEGADDATADVAPATVSFADEKLEACVRTALGIPDAKLTPDDLGRLEQLECQDAQIASIDGLQLAHNLSDLSLWENEIADLSPLSGLTTLTYLQLGNNKITNLSPLSGLTKLQRLGLAINEIADISPLAELAELRWLNLDNNKVAAGQTAHLGKLTQLTWLTLEHNEVPETEVAAVAAKLAGAQVYRELGAAAKRAAAAPRLALPTADLLPLRRGTLIPEVREDGEVRFVYQIGERRLEGLREYAGRIVVRGDDVHHEAPAGDVVIGQRSGGHLALCQGPLAAVCELSVGIKTGRTMLGSSEPVVTVRLSSKRPRALVPIAAGAPYASDRDLIDYALASPNQLDGATCLYMSNTGAMEILLNQHTDPALIAYDGPTDLSERYLISASSKAPWALIRYSISDLLYTYNHFGGSLLNKDYPFTAGFVKQLASGQYIAAGPDDGEFSCAYNWINELPLGWESGLVPTPLVERTSIFIEPTRSQESVWNVALMNDDIVERIKYELRSKNAPVIVVYNHYLYWHAAVVVGYDDDAPTDCAMVNSSLQYFQQQEAVALVNKIKSHMATVGACANKGVFYVRDSIYEGGPEEPEYSYSNVYNFTKKYSKRITEHSYGWVKALANHAYTVHRY